MMKTDDPLFNINFVRVIENLPCIWNHNLREYCKREVTEEAWAQVAIEVKNSVSNCRDRWRNLRGAFLRSLKKPPSGSVNEKKKYYLNEYLQFLIPYTKSKSCNGNLETLTESSGNSDKLSIFEPEKLYSESQHLHTDHHNDDNDASSSLHDMIEDNAEQLRILGESINLSNQAHDTKKRKCDQDLAASSNPVDEAFINWLNSKKERSSIDQNPNMLFLRSLLSDMMKMTDQQNRRFRQKVIGLMEDILEDNDMHTNKSSYMFLPKFEPKS